MAVLSVTFAFAQKKEVAAAYKAAKSGDVATANSQIAAAEGIMGGKTELLEPASLEQYYYAKGMALMKSGKTLEGAQYLGKISDLGKAKIYSGKDGKSKVYYVGKAAADKSGIAGLKEEVYQPTLVGELATALDPQIQANNKAAMEAYEAKNYAVAAPKFREVYNLLKAAGNDNQQYLYYSGITYALAKDNKNAISVYDELINSGYTGVSTNYTAKNAKGEVEQLNQQQWELMKKSSNSGYTDFKTETSKSVEEELYETSTGLLLEDERYDDAIAMADKGMAKFKNNSKLSEMKGVAYFKSGKTDQFFATLKDNVAKNPRDKDSWYNMGILASKDPARLSEAEGYFLKALEVDPNNVQALQAIFYNVYMGDDGAVIAKAEEARKAKKMDEFNKIMNDRRARLAKGLPYVERWYALDQNNIEVVSLLKGLYQSTHNEAKRLEFKAKEEALKKK